MIRFPVLNAALLGVAVVMAACDSGSSGGAPGGPPATSVLADDQNTSTASAESASLVSALLGTDESGLITAANQNRLLGEVVNILFSAGGADAVGLMMRGAIPAAPPEANFPDDTETSASDASYRECDLQGSAVVFDDAGSSGVRQSIDFDGCENRDGSSLDGYRVAQVSDTGEEVFVNYALEASGVDNALGTGSLSIKGFLDLQCESCEYRQFNFEHRLDTSGTLSRSLKGSGSLYTGGGNSAALTRGELDITLMLAETTSGARIRLTAFTSSLALDPATRVPFEGELLLRAVDGSSVRLQALGAGALEVVRTNALGERSTAMVDWQDIIRR
ncbi:MAG: hypothetical protein CSB44_04370 [Gammaproteobacteria bacterium]|nr:MAG: hypothetical protein CSB44_04370 [Gammaproteobacteria bacterium]